MMKLTKTIKDRFYFSLSVDKELYYVTSKSGSKRYHFLNFGFDRFYGGESGSATVLNITIVFASLSVGWLFKN